MSFTKENIDEFGSLETPFYHYNLEVLDRTLSAVEQAASDLNYHVHYALKANSNPTILKRISKVGLGADCVSGNEILRALETGFNPSSIVFAGVGKTDKEIKTALEAGIYCFNCESIEELGVINELAAYYQRVTNVAIRINPNVEAKTHKYITTGKEENKFGIGIHELTDVLEVLSNCANLKLKGIHFHIGSQIRDLQVFQNLCSRINEVNRMLKDKGVEVEDINVGGGLGVNYSFPDEELIPDFKAYFNTFDKYLEKTPSQQVHFELGRSIVAQCGNLIHGR